MAISARKIFLYRHLQETTMEKAIKIHWLNHINLIQLEKLLLLLVLLALAASESLKKEKYIKKKVLIGMLVEYLCTHKVCLKPFYSFFFYTRANLSCA